jgi:hypothetical protein
VSQTDIHIPSNRLSEVAFHESRLTSFEKAHLDDCVECLRALVETMHDIIRKHETTPKKSAGAGRK